MGGGEYSASEKIRIEGSHVSKLMNFRVRFRGKGEKLPFRLQIHSGNGPDEIYLPFSTRPECGFAALGGPF